MVFIIVVLGVLAVVLSYVVHNLSGLSLLPKIFDLKLMDFRYYSLFLVQA